MRASWATADAADLRIGDAERERAASLLNRHFAEGRLTPLEHAERTELALASRTAGDLDALFADLPLQDQSPGQSPARSPVTRVTRALGRPTHVLAAAVLVAAALFVLAHLLPVIAVVLLGFFVLRLVVRPGRRSWHRFGPVVQRRW